MPRTTSPVTAAWTSLNGGFLAVGVFSLVLNLLMLAGPLYMLQVYDRVLTSQNTNTLLALTLLLGCVFLVTAGLDLLRMRILGRLAARFELKVGLPLLEAAMRRRVQGKSASGENLAEDLSGIRDFVSGSALTALFDAPWIPVYLCVLMVLHPYLGLLGLAGALVLTALALINNMRSTKPMQSALEARRRCDGLFEAGEMNAELVHSMGMRGDLARRWGALQLQANAFKMRANDRNWTFAVVSKTIRMGLQSAILGLGAALAISGDATAGVMIAASIILGRALAPIDQLIGQWRGLIAARGSYQKIISLVEDYPADTAKLSLPRPRKSVGVNIRQAGPPLACNATLSAISFELAAGDVLAVIGPSGSGKSTLAKMLTGVWMPQRGDIALDGMATAHWDGQDLGQLMGYLPQDVTLFDGTIRENIARFSSNIDDALVLDAALAADVHEMISQLPEGYETRIGDGYFLSGGQRQRIALARALYDDPFLLVLDEPNSDLDATGEAALRGAMLAAQERGAIVVVMTHRPSTLQAVNKVLILDAGRQTAFGDKDEVLKVSKRNVLEGRPHRRVSVVSPQHNQERAVQ
ncbi:MAG: type I secretion system permease/ATPase [Pseudomonadota bacterium]